MKKRFIIALALFLGVIGVVMPSGAVYAAEDAASAATTKEDCDKAKGVWTATMGCVKSEGGAGIWTLIQIVLNVLSGLVIALAVTFLIVAGIQYSSARDNPEQVKKAKARILNIVIGLVAYTIMWAVLSWLMPGGIGV